MSEVKARANVLLEEAAQRSMEEIKGTLRDLGLSGYASDAFCALARMAKATAGDLVLKTGIPDSKIYYALNELVERGLVEVQAGKPKLYRAVTPQDVETRLQRILDTKHEREQAAVSRVGALLEPIQAATQSPSADLAYIVKGESNVVARARNLVGSARREAVLIASEEPFVRKLEEGLAKAARKGVKVRLAIPDVELDGDLARSAEIRSIVCSGIILVVDGQQMLTVNRTMDGSVYGITSTDETLVRLGQDYWESPQCCVQCR
jgi:sugar-specific transcriptional regulator TrmB